MKVHLHLSGNDLAPSLQTLIEQHFRFAATPCSSALQEIHVTLSDVGNSVTGAVKRCEAVLFFRDGGSLKIRRQEARAERAVQRVAERIFRSLRNLRKRRRPGPGLSTVA
jgi:ribosome-associated translation inhibitor RaiA